MLEPVWRQKPAHADAGRSPTLNCDPARKSSAGPPIGRNRAAAAIMPIQPGGSGASSASNLGPLPPHHRWLSGTAGLGPAVRLGGSGVAGDRHPPHSAAEPIRAARAAGVPRLLRCRRDDVGAMAEIGVAAFEPDTIDDYRLLFSLLPMELC